MNLLVTAFAFGISAIFAMFTTIGGAIASTEATIMCNVQTATIKMTIPNGFTKTHNCFSVCLILLVSN